MARAPFRMTIVLGALSLGACGNPAPMPTGGAAMADANDMTAMPMPDGKKVDMSGVPQFPGAVMVDMKIMPHEADDMMHFNFDAPAVPATVMAWYLAELPKHGFTVAANGAALVGTDGAHNPFRLDLEAAPGGHTLGSISKG